MVTGKGFWTRRMMATRGGKERVKCVHRGGSEHEGVVENASLWWETVTVLEGMRKSYGSQEAG